MTPFLYFFENFSIVLSGYPKLFNGHKRKLSHKVSIFIALGAYNPISIYLKYIKNLI